MVVVSRRDKRAEILGKALTGQQKEAPQTDEVVTGGTTTTTTVTTQQPSQETFPDRLLTTNELRNISSYDRETIALKLEAQARKALQLSAELKKAGKGRASRGYADQASRSLATAKRIRSGTGAITNREAVSVAKARFPDKRFPDLEAKYGLGEQKQRAEAGVREKQAVQASGLSSAEYRELDKQQRYAIQESYRQGGAIEAEKTAFITTREAKPSERIVGTTDLNKLAKQYSTAGEFLPEVKRRESRGETLQYTRQPLSVDVKQNQSYYVPEPNFMRATGEAVYVSPSESRISLARRPGVKVIEAGTGRNILSENIRYFERTSRRLFPERFQALEPYVKYSPKLTLAREAKFFVTPSPEIQATQEATLPSSSAVVYEAEGWTTARGRRAGVTLFKEGVTDTIAGISGRPLDRALFATSVVAPFMTGKTQVASGTVGRIVQTEAWQTARDVTSATLISAFVGGSREQPGAYTAGQFTPYVATSAGTLLYRSGRNVLTSPQAKAFAEAVSVRAGELKKDLRTGTKLLLETRTGKRGVSSRRKRPTTLAERSKQSRGQVRQAKDIRFTAVDLLKAQQTRTQVYTIRSTPKGDITGGYVKTVSRPSAPKKPKVSQQVPPSETRAFTKTPKPPQTKTVRQPKQVRVVYGTELKGTTRKGRVGIYTDYPVPLTKRQLRRQRGKVKATGVRPEAPRQQVLVQEPVQKLGRVGSPLSQPKKPKPAKKRELTQREPDTSALDTLSKGRFDSLSPKRKKVVLVEEQTSVAPKGFRPGTREAVLGRVEAFKQERIRSITREPIFPVGTRERPATIKGIATGSVLTPLTSTSPRIDIKPLTDTRPDTDITQSIIPATTQRFRQAQDQAQDQLFDQELAYKYSPIFEQPKTIKDFPEPTPPGRRPPRPPTQLIETRPRRPVPKIPREPRPREPKTPIPKIPVFKIPDLPFPDFAPLRTKAYDVYANIKGDFVKLNKQELTKSQALGKGAGVIATTPLASFKIAETGNYLSEEDEGLNKRTRKLFKQFRKPKRSSKLRTNDYTFVEKRKYRIDTPGELSGITYKGISTRRRR